MMRRDCIRPSFLLLSFLALDLERQLVALFKFASLLCFSPLLVQLRQRFLHARVVRHVCTASKRALGPVDASRSERRRRSLVVRNGGGRCSPLMTTFWHLFRVVVSTVLLRKRDGTSRVDVCVFSSSSSFSFVIRARRRRQSRLGPPVWVRHRNAKDFISYLFLDEEERKRKKERKKSKSTTPLLLLKKYSIILRRVSTTSKSSSSSFSSSRKVFIVSGVFSHKAHDKAKQTKQRGKVSPFLSCIF